MEDNVILNQTVWSPRLKDRKSTIQELRKLTEFHGSFNDARSFRYVLMTLLINFLSLYVLSYLLKNDFLTILNAFILYIIIGITYYQYQFILHEASHATLFSSRKLNDFIGIFAAFLSGYNFKDYRIGHMKHHKYLGTNDDPEFKNFISTNKLKTFIKSLFFIDFILLLKNLFLVRNDSNNNFKSFQLDSKLNLILTSILYVSISILLLGFSRNTFIFLLFIILSVGSLTFGLNRLRSILEHPMTDSRIETVSHLSNGLLSKLLAPFNFNYHFEHHLFPEVNSGNYIKINQILGHLDIHQDHYKKFFLIPLNNITFEFSKKN